MSSYYNDLQPSNYQMIFKRITLGMTLPFTLPYNRSTLYIHNVTI